ncbi:unnamed protein product [Echinostoma caproni]|uniref:Syntaxin-6_N domain-containing protein n=1 Tax=Echinostoma caproni TaxID=27848 RepID=A0A183B401_9TREM|nr:unnamed protein product [Echinostoma caproni]
MDEGDPYFTVQDEVLKNLENVSALYDQWLRSDSSTDPQKLVTNIKQVVRNIEWDLEDIQVFHDFPLYFI